jgi:biopolymer transport protein ExbD
MRLLCLLLLPLLPAGDGAPGADRVPEEAAMAVFARTPAAELARYLADSLAALVPSDLPGLPDLGSLRPDRSPLRLWFEARGVTRSRAMLHAFAEGLLRRAAGVPPDWEGAAREAAEEELREFGPPVDVPSVWGWAPPDRDGLLGGASRTLILTVTKVGQVWLDGREVSLDDLSDRLFPHAEMVRDDGDPRKPSWLIPVLRVDRETPWDRARAVFAALDHPALRFARVGFVFSHDHTDDLGGESFILPSGAPAAPGPDVLSLSLRNSDERVETAVLTAYLLRRFETPPGAVLSVDPSLSFGDVCPVLSAIREAGISGVTFADFPADLRGPPDPDARVWLDGQPLFDPRDPAEAARLALSLTPPAELIRTIERFGATLVPQDIPGVPSNWIRPGRLGAFALWEWFAARGVDDPHEAIRALCEGIEAMARGVEPDFERLAAEGLRRQGPPVELPCVPATRELWYDGTFDDNWRKRTLKGRVDVRGRLFIQGELVAPAELFLKVEQSRGGVLELYADRRLPFRGFAPVLIGYRSLGEKWNRVALHYYIDDSIFDWCELFNVLPVEIDPILGWQGPSLRLHLAEGPDPAAGVAEIAAALASRGEDLGEVLFVVDDGVPLQRVMEAAAACIRAGIRGFMMHVPGDFAPWVADPPASVCLDGVPVRAARK